MPELSPKQLAVWLLIAAVVLFIGARALRGEQATGIDLAAAGAAQSGNGTGNSDTPPRRSLEIGESRASPAPGKKRLQVHVAGAVRRPGLYRLAATSRIADAVNRAGGSLAAADLDRINLAQSLTDGQQILVPRRGEPDAAASPIAESAGALDPSQPGPISLSTATAADLETLDGIGPVTAAKILEYRASEGSVSSIEQLDVVPGIGPATMQTLRQALVP